MKKAIAVFLHFIIGAHFTYGQTYTGRAFNLSSSMIADEDITYTARDYVSLQAGFYGESDPAALTFETNPELIVPFYWGDYVDRDYAEDRVLDQDLEVGAIGGSFSVSSTGNAQYQVPIYIPPGTGGMQPSLAISYNSGNPNGLLGVGWDLSGTPTIHRVSKSMHYDSTRAGIQMDETDILAISGNRLILSSGSYSEDGSTYATYFTSYNTIEANGTVGDGPSWFEVTSNTGVVYEYGNSTDSKVKMDGITTVLSWKLNKVTDPYGNYMEYEYDNTQSGRAYLTSIKYTGNSNASLDPYNEIRLLYQIREDSTIQYVGGGKIQDTYLLRKILVEAQGDLQREYAFKYHDQDGTYLSEIQEQNGESEEHNSTVIAWNADTVVIDTIATVGFQNAATARFGDFDDDGFDDYISIDESESDFSAELYLNDQEGGFSSTSYSKLFQDETYVEHLIDDFDGDGKMEAAIVSIDTCWWWQDWPTGYIHRYEAIYKYTFVELDNSVITIMDSYSFNTTCSGFFDISIPWTYDSDEDDRFFSGDVNGDGISDFIFNGSDGLVLLGDTDGSNFTAWEYSISVGEEKSLVGEFTGDGVVDYATISSDSIFQVYSFSSTGTSSCFSETILGNLNFLYPGDYNADGLMDLFFCITNEGWYFQYGNGTGLTDTIKHEGMTIPGSLDYLCKEVPIDFNGDGATDIISMLYDPIIVAPNKWEIIFRKSMKNGDFESAAIMLDAYSSNYGNTQAADLNGDGADELIHPMKDVYYSIHPNDKRSLVRYIENGMGLRTSFTFKTLVEATGTSYHRDDESTFPMYTSGDPIWVVDSFETTSTLHDSAVISSGIYEYTNARIHKQGLGFLGFEKVERVIDSVYKSISYHSYTEPDYFAHTDSVKSYYANTLVSTQISNKKHLEYTQGSAEGYIIYADSIVGKDHINGNSQLQSLVLDTLGNLTESKTLYDDGSYVKTNYYDYLKDGSKFPARVVKTSKHSDDSSPFSSESRFTYDTTKLHLLTGIQNYGKSNQHTTSLSDFNSFGIPLTREATPLGLTKQTVTSTVDETGRFVTETETVLGSTTRSFDEYTGQLIKETDLYGNEMYYSYNAWGELLSTASSDSVTTEREKFWPSSGDPEGTLVVLYERNSLSTYSKQYVSYKGQKLRSEKEGFDGNIYLSDTWYGDLNRVDSVSNLYQSGGTPLWSTFEYNTADGRISSQTAYTGSTVTYSYSSNHVDQTINSRTYSTDFDVLGNITETEDPLGNTLTYEYTSSGAVDQVSGNGGTITTTFDQCGRDSLYVDPSLGTISKTYNSANQLTWMEDGRGNEFEYSYDTLLRVTRMENKNNSSEYYTYAYVSSGNGLGQLSAVNYTNGTLSTAMSYTYNEKGRKRSESKTIGAKTHTLYYSYDSYGRLDSITDSNDRKLDYRYDVRGYLVKLYFEGDKVWELSDLTLEERVEYLGSDITLMRNFDSYGMPSSIEAGDLFDMEYTFDPVKGNLSSRTQRIFDLSGQCTDTLTESFTFDELDRLLAITSSGENVTVDYDASVSERIAGKTDAGEHYEYMQDNAFQLDKIDTASQELLDRPDRYVSYNSINKIDSISEGDFLLTFDYGPSQERVRMQVYQNDTLSYTRYYFGNYEETEYADSSYRKDTWLNSSYGVFAFHRETDQTDSLYYVISDHLGSVMTVANEAGDVREYYSYDAWGRRRDAQDWSYDSVYTTDYTNRGYTFHEHIDEVKLVNMNGRVYDPLIGLFLSPDPIIQAPTNPLNYNRYSYVLNNPLKYTDPSGYKIFALPEISWGSDPTSLGGMIGRGGGGSSNWNTWEDIIATRSWEYDDDKGVYVNSYTGESKSPDEFSDELSNSLQGNGSSSQTESGQGSESSTSSSSNSHVWGKVAEMIRPGYDLSISVFGYIVSSNTMSLNFASDPPDMVSLFEGTIEGFVQWFQFLQENRSYFYENNITYNVNQIVDKNTVNLNIQLKHWRLMGEERYNGQVVQWNISDYQFYKEYQYDDNYVDYVLKHRDGNTYRIHLMYNMDSKITLNTSSVEAFNDIVRRIFGNVN